MVMVAAGTTLVCAMPAGDAAASEDADDTVVMAHCVAWYVKVDVPACDAR